MKPVKYLTEWVLPYYHNCRFDLATSGVPEDMRAVPKEAGREWHRLNPLYAIEEARARIARLYGVKAELVELTFGGTEGLFAAAFVLSRKAGAAVVESPVYEPVFRNFEALGSEVRFLERRPEESYSLAALCEKARELVRGASCLVVTNPHNPSGVYDGVDTVRLLAEAIDPVYLVVNEAYLPLVPGARSAFGSARNICVISTLTKAFGIALPRFAWTVSPEPLADEIRDAAVYLHGQYSGTVAALSLPVLDKLKECLSASISHLAGRKQHVDSLIGKSKRVNWQRPPGNVVIALVTVEGVQDDFSFAKALFEKHGVITAPGAYFRAPGRLRLGIGAYADKFDGGLKLFLDFADKRPRTRDI